jgi:transcription initiation factor TFIID subunit 4
MNYINKPPINNGTVHSTVHDDHSRHIKSENIQSHQIQPQQTSNRPIQPAIRHTPPVSRILVAPVRPSGISNSISSSPAPPPQQMSTVQRLTAPTQQQPGGGGQISGLSPEDQSTVQKCKNFLMTLIQLAQRNDTANPQTVHNVKELVQQLIDNSITAEAFTERLQTELQSSPQPYLVPFLRKSLPLLRRSMHQSNQTPQPTPNLPTRTLPAPTRPPAQPSPNTMPGAPPGRILIRQQRAPLGVPKINITGIGGPTNRSRHVRPPPGQVPRHYQGPPTKMAKPEHDNQGDDDFTDVTAMADVNIATETEHLATSAEIGTEIRGAPGGDEAASVNKNVLHKLVGQAASRSGGIDRVTPDGARLIGLALEEYIKSLVSKAIHAASHRTIQFRESEHREKVTDVKNQFKFLHDLMLVERTQAEEAEQEMRAKLLRSRNKKDDNPDHEKRKKEAKLKQQAQQEAEQQKQADATALAASNRRRQPAGAPTSSIAAGSTSRPTRVCRVKIRDVLFCLESEKLDRNSRDEMFKRYLK